MGYQTTVSPPGPDGGVDVLAHKDAFGFEKPKLLGANPIDANSIFVSTGGFTSHAVKVAKHNGVKTIDLAELVQFVLQWYEDLPVETKALLPLKKIYVPN